MKKYILILPALVVATPLLIAFARGTKPETPESIVLAKRLRAERDALGPRPRIVVPQPVYDFGRMNPLTMGTHDFEIRNEGNAPLELTPGTTTCKCTLSKITRRAIPPGESGTVRLTWNSGRKHRVYSHGATIHTNDIFKETIDLRIEGTVHVLLATSPEELVLPRVEPDAPAAIHSVIYSQIWEAFSIEDVSCSLEGATLQIEAADDQTLGSLEAKSGHHITVTVPGGLPPGHFQGEVHLKVLPKGSTESESLDVPLSGNVIRRLAVYGPGIDSTGTVDMGILALRQGLKRRLLMKVRDHRPDIVIKGIEAGPDFLQVNVTPHRAATEATGLYYLEIVIPDDAPECAFRGSKLGQIRLAIDHPRIENLTLKARFAIVADNRTL